MNNVKNLRIAFGALAVSTAMLGLSFAAVPFYKAFCQATGFGGTTQRADLMPTHLAHYRGNSSHAKLR
jgi:cytochrome c oxidase assembly protein subunit 11